MGRDLDIQVHEAHRSPNSTESFTIMCPGENLSKMKILFLSLKVVKRTKVKKLVIYKGNVYKGSAETMSATSVG